MAEHREDGLQGVDETSTSTEATRDGGENQSGERRLEGDIGIGDESSLTDDGGIAIAGGKLPGNKDDFEHELDNHRPKPVPGADPNNQVRPPNERDLRQ